MAKFTEGAWLVVAVLPLLVTMFWSIRRHYRSIEDRLLIAATEPVRIVAAVPRVVVPISRIDRASVVR